MQTAMPLETQAIETRALSIPEEAKAINVTDDESFQKAGRILLIIKEVRKEIDATFDPIIKKAHESHKEAVAQKKKVDAPLIEAEGIIKPRLAAYHEEQERKRREEEEKTRAEALKKAEDDRLLDAVSAEQSGMTDLSDSILEGPAYVPTIVTPQSNVVKMQGVSFRDSWKAEVFDMKALLKAVLDGRVPMNVIEVNTTVLNGLARSLKGQINYPGVRTVCEKVTSAGSGRR